MDGKNTKRVWLVFERFEDYEDAEYDYNVLLAVCENPRIASRKLDEMWTEYLASRPLNSPKELRSVTENVRSAWVGDVWSKTFYAEEREVISE